MPQWSAILRHDLNRWVGMTPQQMEIRVHRMSKTDKLAATLAVAEIAGASAIRQRVLDRAEFLGKQRLVIDVANGIPASSIITTDILRRLTSRYGGEEVIPRERDEARRGYPATLSGRILPLGDSRLDELRGSSPPVNVTVTGRAAGRMLAASGVNSAIHAYSRKKVKTEPPKLRKIRFKKKKEKRKIRFKKGK